MTGPKEDTALGVARARFVDGLVQKASELKASLAMLAASPESIPLREEMRRRLHALYASAQVFRIDTLAQPLKECIEILDQARNDKRGLVQDEIVRIAHIASTLQSLATTPAPVLPLPNTSTRKRMGTLIGIGLSVPQPKETIAEEHLAPPAKEIIAEDPLAPPAKETPVQQSRSVSVPPQGGRGSSLRTSFVRGETTLTLETVVSVLLIGDVAKRLATRLPKERFEIVLADESDYLMKAKIGAPDVILIGDDLLSSQENHILSTLRAESATESVSIIAVATRYGADIEKARSLGADDVVSQVADARLLLQIIGRASGLMTDTGQTLSGAMTLRVLADRLADEFRKGILDSVEKGLDESFTMEDSSEAMAAVWSAIARVRYEVGATSSGRIKFRNSAKRGGPAVLGVGPSAQSATASDIRFDGKRILVIDDDPATVWFFAGLLREAGAIVEETYDGEEGLQAARRSRPDVVLSDILMPKLDGLALCREFKREPILASVPIILLSWKEDFLQRMRELRSGASGYLRKEEGTEQILLRVWEVLNPFYRLEKRFSQQEEVRGRIEEFGIYHLIQLTCRIRKNASIAIRDLDYLFEIEIRDGQLIALTRTASDGNFSRGQKALLPLLTILSGRFSVSESSEHVRSTLKISFEEIEKIMQSLGDKIYALSARNFIHIDKIEFDENMFVSLMNELPLEEGLLVDKIYKGASLQGLLQEGQVTSSILESILTNLVYKGAIVSVHKQASQSEKNLVIDEDEFEDSTRRFELSEEFLEEAKSKKQDHLHNHEFPVDDFPLLIDTSNEIDVPSEEEPQRDTELNLISELPVAPNLPSPPLTSSTTNQAVAATDQTQKKSTRGWVLFLFAIAIAAFVAAYLYRTKQVSTRSRTSPSTSSYLDSSATRESTQVLQVAVDASLVVNSSQRLPEEPSLYGTLIEGIEDAGITVGQEQGLLIIQAPDDGQTPQIEIDGRSVGSAPLRIALNEGRYTIVLKRGDETSYRFVWIEKGKTRSLPAD